MVALGLAQDKKAGDTFDGSCIIKVQAENVEKFSLNEDSNKDVDREAVDDVSQWSSNFELMIFFKSATFTTPRFFFLKYFLFGFIAGMLHLLIGELYMYQYDRQELLRSQETLNLQLPCQPVAMSYYEFECPTMEDKLLPLASFNNPILSTCHTAPFHGDLYGGNGTCYTHLVVFQRFKTFETIEEYEFVSMNTTYQEHVDVCRVYGYKCQTSDMSPGAEYEYQHVEYREVVSVAARVKTTTHPGGAAVLAMIDKIAKSTKNPNEPYFIGEMA